MIKRGLGDLPRTMSFGFTFLDPIFSEIPFPTTKGTFNNLGFVITTSASAGFPFVKSIIFADFSKSILILMIGLKDITASLLLGITSSMFALS